jgi:hypothetical protein
MAKKKTENKTEDAVVETTQEEEQKEDVQTGVTSEEPTTNETEAVVDKKEELITKEEDKELRKTGLNAKTSIAKDIVQEEDTTVVSYDSIIEAVDEVISKHYTANKPIGVKRITNHVRKLLNQQL